MMVRYYDVTVRIRVEAESTRACKYFLSEAKKDLFVDSVGIDVHAGNYEYRSLSRPRPVRMVKP